MATASSLFVTSATGAVVGLILGELLRRDWHKRREQRLTETIINRVKFEVLEQSPRAVPASPRGPSLRRQSSSGAIGGRRGSGTLPPSYVPEADSAAAAAEFADADDEASGVVRPIRKHTEDTAFRAIDVSLMERGRAAKARPVVDMWGPTRTKVVRICLTGGPCAGKTSVMQHLIDNATREGFDVLTAPEVATLYFNSSYQFPDINSPRFVEEKYTFQLSILKLQLTLERAYTDLAASTGRPTIVIFDRGMRDCLAFMAPGEWPRALETLNQEMANGPAGRITDEYTLQRYDGVVHLVTAADGAGKFYKFGVVEDDSGGRVYRRETPHEAVEQDQRINAAWKEHPRHVIVTNEQPNGFEDSCRRRLTRCSPSRASRTPTRCARRNAEAVAAHTIRCQPSQRESSGASLMSDGG